MNESRTEYTALQYVWKLFEDEKQIATGYLQTNARMEFESHAAFQAGDAPVRVYHKSAQMKSRKQASVQLSVLRPNINGDWGKWQTDKDSGLRTAPLLVDDKAAFRIQLEVK